MSREVCRRRMSAPGLWLPDVCPCRRPKSARGVLALRGLGLLLPMQGCRRSSRDVLQPRRRDAIGRIAALRLIPYTIHCDLMHCGGVPQVQSGLNCSGWGHGCHVRLPGFRMPAAWGFRIPDQSCSLKSPRQRRCEAKGIGVQLASRVRVARSRLGVAIFPRAVGRAMPSPRECRCHSIHRGTGAPQDATAGDRRAGPHPEVWSLEASD